MEAEVDLKTVGATLREVNEKPTASAAPNLYVSIQSKHKC